MKITPTTHTQPITPSGTEGSARRASSAPADAGPAARTSLSPDAHFVQAAREATGTEEPYRADLVDQVRGQIADGTFGADIDMNRVLDGLLADL